MRTRTEGLLGASALGLAIGALLLGHGSPLSAFAALLCGVYGAVLIAWTREPDPSTATIALLVGGFLRILLGPIGMGALLLVPLMAGRLAPDQRRHLVGSAVGIHLAVFLAHQLAVALGEPFPSLAAWSPSEALLGLAWFVPFVVLQPGDEAP